MCPTSPTRISSPTPAAPGRGPISGDGVSRGGLGATARRDRDHLDGDDAVQPRPAPACGTCRRRHSRGGRDTGRVQHDRGLRQPHPGHAGNAGIPRQPRGDRRLDRARRPQPAFRRTDLPGGLRQDGSGSADGARAARRPGVPLLLGRGCGGVPRRPPGDDQGSMGRRRRVRGRSDLPRGARQSRTRCVPRDRCLCRPVHREHHGRGERLPRACPRRRRRAAGGRSGEGRLGGGGGPARDGRGLARRAALVVPHAGIVCERDRRRRRHRWLDERRAAPAGDRRRGRRRARPGGLRPALTHRHRG